MTTDQVLRRAVEQLEGAYRAAQEKAGTDVLSPWSTAACSIDQVAGWLRRQVPDAVEPVEAQDAGDVHAALSAARTILLELRPDDSLTATDLMIARTWLAAAISDADQLRDHAITTS